MATLKDLEVLGSMGGGLCRKVLDLIYPVGILVEFAENYNPNDHFYGQVWVKYGQGRVTVGQTDSGTFATLGGTTGEETHKLTTNEMPSHNHSVTISGDGYNHGMNGGGDASGKHRFGNGTENNNSEWTISPTISSTGGGQAHNNIQPSIVVMRWKRKS